MNVTDKVIEIILYHAGSTNGEISEDTLIEDGLGVTGDDAWELIEDFQNKFDVDMNSFEFSLHFGPEAGFHVAEEYGYYPVSLKHLVEVAEERKWKLPVRSEEHYLKYLKDKRKQRIIWLVFVVGAITLLISYEFSRGASGC
nr:DUF1493 family protein [uncultured Desulfuromonas sp.]